VAETQTVEAPEKTRGKKKPSQQTERPELKNKSLTFFQRLAKIPKEDWGTRAKLRIYRIEPIIDRLRGSQTKYITIYEEPITEEKIKVDHGSGRYRVYLNFKQPSQEDREVDSVELDILDLNFPPKVPAGDWVDDARNKKWAWAAPKGVTITEAPSSNGNSVSDVVETIKAVRELDGKEERRSPMADTLDTIKVMRELNPPPAPATENGLLNTIAALMMKQMEQQGDIVKQQMAAKDAEAKELRDEMRQMRNKPADNNGLSAIKELFSEVKTFLPILKDTFPGATEVIGGGLSVRGRGRPQWWETLLESPVIADAAKPIGQALGSVIVGAMNRNNPANAQRLPPQQPAPQPQQIVEAQPTQQPQPKAADVLDFVFINRFPILKHFAMWCDTEAEEWAGQGLANWLNDGFGTTWEGIDWHAQMKAAGVDNLLAACQQHPVLQQEIWSKVSTRADKFKTFLADFAAWEPEAEDNLITEPAQTDLT
jgi:hypothetical protein